MGVYTTIDPATGDATAQYPEISDAELDNLIGTSAAAYRSWRATPLEQRRAVLTRTAEIHRDQADELAKLLTLAMGRPVVQARAMWRWSPRSTGISPTMWRSTWRTSAAIRRSSTPSRSRSPCTRSGLMNTALWRTRSATDWNQFLVSVPPCALPPGFAREPK